MDHRLTAACCCGQVDGLLLDPEHARNGDPPLGAPEAIKAIIQRDFAECIQQLSLFPPGEHFSHILRGI
jgi:hypothetical protein